MPGPTPPPTVRSAAPPRGARWRLDAGAVFLYLGLGALFSATPRYVHEQLGGSKAMAGFSVSIFFVAAIITRPVAGRLVDRHGRRPFLVVPPLIILAVMLGFHLAADLEPQGTEARSIALVLGLRFVQGVAGSTFYVAAVTASTDLSPPDRRASAVARLSIALYAGFATGPALGEALLDHGQAVTWNVLAAVVGASALIVATMPETRPAEHADEAHPPTRLIHPAAVLPGLCLLTLGVGYTSITAHSALYARSIGMESSTVLYIVFAGSILGVRLVGGSLADRVGPLRVIYPGIASLAGGMLVLAVLEQPVPAVVGVALVGIGWALVFPAVIAWLSAVVPDTERGAAVGSVVAFMDIGQGFGGYLVGALADLSGFALAYAFPALLAVTGAGFMARAARRRPEATSTAPTTPTNR
jgi:MFS family permease